MKTLRLLISGSIVLLAWAAEGQEAVPRALHGDHAGYPFYRKYCASCHGVAADGLGPVAPALRSPPPDLTHLTDEHGVPLKEQAIRDSVDGRKMVRAHGTSDMPVWGDRLYEDLSPTAAKQPAKRMTIALIVDYLLAIQRKE